MGSRSSAAFGVRVPELGKDAALAALEMTVVNGALKLTKMHLQ